MNRRIPTPLPLHLHHPPTSIHSPETLPPLQIPLHLYPRAGPRRFVPMSLCNGQVVQHVHIQFMPLPAPTPRHDDVLGAAQPLAVEAADPEPRLPDVRGGERALATFGGL